MDESTIQALEPLYPKLSTGGFCIANGIADPIEDIDGSGAFWRKTKLLRTGGSPRTQQRPEAISWILGRGET